MGTKLYIGSLSYSTDEEGLRTAFSEAGNISSVQIIRDRDTGLSKGFGFVEMETDEEAQNAVNLLNGATVDNRQIRVEEARPRQPRSGGGGGGGRGGGYGGGGGGGGRDRW